MSVLKVFEFETRNFKKWSCDTLEHYCTRNHIALLFHLELHEITWRCYSTQSLPKSHRVAISLEFLKSHRVAILLVLLPQITPRCYFQPTRALIAGFSLANNTIPWLENFPRTISGSMFSKPVEDFEKHQRKKFFRISCSFTSILNF